MRPTAAPCCSPPWAPRTPKATWKLPKGFHSSGDSGKGLGVQVIFFLILPVRLKDGRRSRWILPENDRLHGWCWQQGFGFCNHRTLPKIDVSLQHGL